jgi:hypothetical protein
MFLVTQISLWNVICGSFCASNWNTRNQILLSFPLEASFCVWYDYYFEYVFFKYISLYFLTRVNLEDTLKKVWAFFCYHHSECLISKLVIFLSTLTEPKYSPRCLFLQRRNSWKPCVSVFPLVSLLFLPVYRETNLRNCRPYTGPYIFLGVMYHYWE